MVRICMHIVKYNIKKWKQNYNILLGLIYLLIISDMMFRPARKIVEQLGFSPNISSFSLIWNSTFFILLFFLGVILFYSDAPFQDSMTSFVMIRCGKIKFMIAQICYIFLLGILIPGVFFLIQYIFLLPTEADGWGKFWGTIAQTNIAEEAECRLQFDYHILWEYEPKEAFIITFFTCIFLTTITGLFIYLFSLFQMKTLGICLISLFIILPSVVDTLNYTTFYWISPYSWICLDTTSKEYNGILPSVSYTFLMLFLITIVLILLIILRIKKGKESLMV